MQIKDLINWKTLSKTLAGNDNSIRKNSIPKKYNIRVDYLIQLLEIWSRDEDVWTQKEVQQWLDNIKFPK